MPENIFFETGPGASPGLFMHEWTANTRGGLVHQPALPDAELGAPDAWVDDWFDPGLSTTSLDPRRQALHAARHTTLETLARRRSIRRYADQPFSNADLADLLALAYLPQASSPAAQAEPAPYRGLKRWQEQPPASKLIALALRVEGLAPGAYLYQERQQRLRCIRQEDPRGLAGENFFQAEFILAPVILLLVGSLSDMLHRYGDRGYRYMLLDTGVMIQRLYLAASYLDLSSCITGSLVQGAFNRWLGLDGYNASVLMAFVSGHRPGEEVPHAE